MKAVQLLACAAALFAVAGCNKTQDNAASNPPIKLEQIKPPAGSDWTQVVTATPAGGFLMGNPNAKVKLIEIGALTCPHCRAFDEKGVPTLVDTYVKSGQVSWEFRSYLLHGLDVPANLIVRCNGAATFFPLMRAMYKDQISWIERVQGAPEDQLKAAQNLPPNRQFLELAKLAGFPDWAALRGVPQEKSAACLVNTGEVDRLVQMTADVQSQYPDFKGTPAFVINGALVDLGPVTEDQVWPALERKIREAL
jgi:protein-disulfide isomerase